MQKSFLLNLGRVVIVVFALATAAIHLYFAIQRTSYGDVSTFTILFYLNALGYIGLTGAFFLFRTGLLSTLTRLVFIGYTVLTILLWFVMEGSRTSLAYLDKGIEVLLVLVLLTEWVLSRGVKTTHPE